MPATLTIRQKAEQVLEALSISRELIIHSNEVEENYKASYLQNCSVTYQMIQQLSNVGLIDNATIKELSNAFLLYWNESANLTTETFWKKMEELDFHIKRKDPFTYALKNKKFRNEYLAIDAKRNWTQLKNSGLLERFSPKEIEKLEKIIMD